MNRRAKLWWRIVAAALLASVAAANPVLGVLFFLTTPGGILTHVPAHYEIVYELSCPPAQGGAASRENAWAIAMANDPQILEDMIHILKRRVDPGGVYALEWRSLGNRRFEVLMPIANIESHKLKQAYEQALRDAETHNISGETMRQLEKASPADRPAMLEKTNLNELQVQSLEDLARKHDAWQAALERLPALKQKLNDAVKEAHAGQPSTPSTQPDPKVAAARDEFNKAQDEAANREVDYLASQRRIEESNIDEPKVSAVLRNFVSARETSQLKKSNLKEFTRRQKAYERGLDGGDGLPGLRQKFKGRQKELDAICSAYEAWANCRTRLDDPSDLTRRIRRHGVLEFRMAPYMQGAQNATDYQIPKEMMDEYIRKLTKEGPEPGRKRKDPYQWFQIHDEDEHMSGVVTGEYGGRTYLLLSNDPNDTMLDPPGPSQWKLADGYPTTDEMGKPAVGFRFDAAGASKFGKLTDAHKKREGGRQGDIMAVLLDDEVYSAPNIQSKITDYGIIQGSFTQQEVMDLVNTFKAGALPAQVNPEPVSVREVPQSPLSGAAAKLVEICALLAVGALFLVLAAIRACQGRAMGCGLFALAAAAATAGFWAILAGVPFCGPVPRSSLFVNAAFAVVLIAAALIGRAGFASKEQQA